MRIDYGQDIREALKERSRLERRRWIFIKLAVVFIVSALIALTIRYVQ